MSVTKDKVKMDVAHHRPPEEPCLVVGIDFGTTYTGIATQLYFPGSKLINDDDIAIVRGWPTAHGSLRGEEADQDKVPTRIVIDDEHNVKAWGYEVEEGDANALELFKLTLKPDDDLPPYLRESTALRQTKAQIQALGLTPTQVIEKYIQMIWAHAQRKIRDGIGNETFNSIRTHVVITIPAIWKKGEIDKMITAAATSVLKSGQGGRKGMTTYEFLSEPEAAMQAYENTLARTLGKNMIVLLADIGGGTTDIIPYQNIGEQGDEMDLKEAATGNGGLYGGSQVDEAFDNLLLSKLPEQYQNLKTDRPGDWRTIMYNTWEKGLKRNFEWHRDSRRYTVRLSQVPPYIEITLHQDEIREVFERSVMPGIIRLIREQIETVKQACNGQYPRMILPVGGFGRCPYLIQRLKEEFETGRPTRKLSRKRARNEEQPKFEKIEVHAKEGNKPWSAVQRGACKSGIRALLGKRLVKGRYARLSLGFMHDKPGKVEEGAIYMQEYLSYVIRGVMFWIVRKGQLVPSDSEKSTKGMELFCDVEGMGIRSERSTFYTYDGDMPPDRFDPNNEGFQEYGVMQITATKPIEELPMSKTDDMRVFPYDLKVQTVGGSLQVTATSAIDEDEGCKVGELVFPELDEV